MLNRSCEKGRFGWTDENEAEVERRWNAGESANQIATALRGNTDLTRNAVIGKVSRMGLRRSPEAAQVAARIARRPAPVAKVPKEPKPKPAAVVALADRRPPPPEPVVISPPDPGRYRILAHLERFDCRWPMGDAGIGQMEHQLFCGAPLDEGEVYCAHHKIEAYPQKKRA